MNQLHPPSHSSVQSTTLEQQTLHSNNSMTLSGIRRAISQVSMFVVKATNSGEAAWREECLKYAFILS